MTWAGPDRVRSCLCVKSKTHKLVYLCYTCHPPHCKQEVWQTSQCQGRGKHSTFPPTLWRVTQTDHRIHRRVKLKWNERQNQKRSGFRLRESQLTCTSCSDCCWISGSEHSVCVCVCVCVCGGVWDGKYAMKPQRGVTHIFSIYTCDQVSVRLEGCSFTDPEITEKTHKQRK